MKDSIKEKMVIEGTATGFICVKDPSTKYDDGGLFNLDIIASETVGKTVLQKIKKIEEEQFNKYRKNNKKAEITACKPYVIVEKDESGRIIKETPVEGKFLIKTKNKAYIKDGKIGKKIPVFDSKLNPVNVPFGAGSRVKVGITLEGYSSNLGTGVSIKLQAVQLLEIQNNNGYSAEDFFTQEDGFVAAEETTPVFEDEDDEEADF